MFGNQVNGYTIEEIKVAFEEVIEQGKQSNTKL